MMKLDHDPMVLEWSSEETPIWYISPADGRPHRYWPDFRVKTKVGEYLWEVKPAAQIIMPKKTAKKTDRRFTKEVITFAINDAKFQAATIYAEKRGWKFKVLTEHDLGIR